MKRKALFLDRDGVINLDRGYVHKIEDFVFTDGIFEALARFQALGYLLVIITNQAGIGRGYYTEEDFHILNRWMLEQFAAQGITIAKVYYSPCHPLKGKDGYRRESDLRKPNPGMILAAEQELSLDLSRSIVIGDQAGDIEAGIRAGVRINIRLGRGRTLPDLIRVRRTPKYTERRWEGQTKGLPWEDRVLL